MRDAVFEAARMYVIIILLALPNLTTHASSIYLVNEDANKEKEFELEMTWVGAETNGLHVPVAQALFDEAEAKAKAAMSEDFEES